MYTHINLMGVIGFSYLSPPLQDVVRASTFLILMVILTVWFSGDLPQIYGELVQALLPLVQSFSPFSLSSTITYVIAFVMDVLLHVVPCCMLGLPESPASFLVALLMLWCWYGIARPYIHEIYSPSVPADRGVVVASAVGVTGALFLTHTKNSTNDINNTVTS